MDALLTLRAGLADGAGIALRPLFAGFALVTLGAGVTLRALQRAVVYPSARHAVVDVNVIRLGRADAVGIANGGILHRGLECRDRAIIALYNKAGAGFTLLSGVAFVTLGALRAAFALRAGFTRNTLCPRNALWASLALRASVAFRSVSTLFARNTLRASVTFQASFALRPRFSARALWACLTFFTGNALRAGITLGALCAVRAGDTLRASLALEFGNLNQVFPCHTVVGILDISAGHAHINRAAAGAAARACRLVDGRNKVILCLCRQFGKISDLRLNRIEPTLGRLVRRLCACFERRNNDKIKFIRFRQRIPSVPLQFALAEACNGSICCCDRPIGGIALDCQRNRIRIAAFRRLHKKRRPTAGKFFFERHKRKRHAHCLIFSGVP